MQELEILHPRQNKKIQFFLEALTSHAAMRAQSNTFCALEGAIINVVFRFRANESPMQGMSISVRLSVSVYCVRESK